MDKITCIDSPACFPCIANHRINEIAETVIKENRLPTEAETEESDMFLRAMNDDIQERSIKRMNTFYAIEMGVVC